MPAHWSFVRQSGAFVGCGRAAGAVARVLRGMSKLPLRRAPAPGFTLLELLIVLALATVFLTAASGFHGGWRQQKLLDDNTLALARALRFARGYAIVSGASTVVCKSADGAACGGDGYEHGWLIFAEKSATKNGKLDDGERLLRVRRNAHGGARATIRANAYHDYIAFNARGRSKGNGRFVVCLDGKVEGAAALVVSQGRLRLAPDGDGDGVVEVNGANIENCLL